MSLRSIPHPPVDGRVGLSGRRRLLRMLLVRFRLQTPIS